MKRPENWKAIHEKLFPKWDWQSYDKGRQDEREALLNSGNFVMVSKDTLTLPGFMTEVEDYLRSLGEGTWVFIPKEE